MSEENRDGEFGDPTAPTWDEPDEASGDGAVGHEDGADQAQPPTPDASQTQVIGDPGTAELPVTPLAVETPLDPPTPPGSPQRRDTSDWANPYGSQQQPPAARQQQPPPYGAPQPQQPFGSQPQQPYPASPQGARSGPNQAGPAAYGAPYGPPGGVQNPYARNPHAQAPTFQQPTGSGTNTSAIVLLVLSALMTLTCLLTQIPALIMAIVALSKNTNDPQGSRRLTRYGWIAFGVGLVIAVIVIVGIIALIATTSSSSSDGYSF